MVGEASHAEVLERVQGWLGELVLRGDGPDFEVARGEPDVIYAAWRD
jgi:hypothetical protein